MENAKELLSQILEDAEKGANKLLDAISAETTREIAKFLLVFSYMLSFSKDNAMRELSDELAKRIVHILIREGYTKDCVKGIFFGEEGSHD